MRGKKILDQKTILKPGSVCSATGIDPYPRAIRKGEKLGYYCDMSNLTLEFSEEEIQEVTNAYRVLQKFLDKIISPNELYTEEFLKGLSEAEEQVVTKEFTEVKDLAGFIQ